ncbi:S41 family peptidase [Shewanella sp. Isolate11]|uniref:S41 family peptidase n=1 Tax=Shewanella sp. Isolate11 TaxID=2908530 RepID=UPI001EFEEE45|nr:S41 family peptidase [Shewanella sp. Isolate11]MCG9696090.1 S41 family peptidase [Shewanella sp. Isolate11]
MTFFRLSQLGGFLASTLILTACGGSSSDNKEELTWVQGEFAPYSTFAGQCEASNSNFALNEKLWLRSWSNDTYLWYDEIIDTDPTPYSVLEYFDLLKTTELSPTGNLKDQFHFSMPTSEWEALNQSGASVGYGFNIYLQQASATTDRQVTITYSEPNSPATDASIERGAIIVSIDGVSVKDANDSDSIAILNNGLFPDEDGQQTLFGILDLGATQVRNVTLTAQTVTSTPVQNVKTLSTTSGNVGYMQFNSHIATAERGLFDAITSLKNTGVSDLVLDLRYNGGGLLAMASQMAYMVAGSQATQNKIFELSTFNDKYPTTNPVTGETLSPMPFYNSTLGFNTSLLSSGQALPTLDLKRVYVLTTDDTCSASEAIINSLRGIDIEVIQLGSTTCGKPYGFYPTPNCGETYFSVQFRGENNKGFGDYSDGFMPSQSPTLESEIQGCQLSDDFEHALGDPNERLLSAALYYRDNASCPAGTRSIAKMPTQTQFVDQGFILQDTRMQTVLKNSRILSQ